MARPKHPYIEIAEVLEEKLRLQRWHDARCDGVMVFATLEDEERARFDAKENRRLARLDIEQSGWPQP